MKVFILFFIALNLYASQINVAVASNVSYAIQELQKEFNSHYPNITINITIGGSGKLAAQIRHGAPYGLFLSANMSYPKRLYKQGIATTQPVVYAQGALVILSNTQRDFSEGIAVLREPNIKKIAIANPKTAPYGVASIEALKNAHLYEKVKVKFIYGESISQTLSYILRAVDIGVIAKSSLFNPKMAHFQEGIHFKEIDPKLYEPIQQGMVLTKYSKNRKEYKLFYNFLLSDKAKEIFKKYGYIV